MATVKNIRLVQGLVDEQALAKLEAGAALHLRHGRISFKILKADEGAITVQTVQSKNPAGVYQDQKTLIVRTKELFSPAFPAHKIHVHVTPFREPATAIVTPQWLRGKLENSQVQAKEIAAQTGLDKTNISAWLNGHRPMSQIVQAMFYYYFKANFPETIK